MLVSQQPLWQGLLFEQVQLGTGFFVFLLCALVFVEDVLGTGAQLIAEGGQDVHFLLIFEEGASACFKVDAEHALVRLDFEDLDHADLSGCGWMCAAAGNAVRGVFDRTDADDGDILSMGERFAQRQLRRLGFCVEMAGDDRWHWSRSPHSYRALRALPSPK